MGFRFLHLADLHLETTFGGRPETRDRLRQATHEAFQRAVDHALEHRLHAVLAAGDLFDDPILSVRTELFFAGPVRRLAQAGIWFLAACGNHDPGGAGFRTAQLGLDGERVHFFRDGQPREIVVTDPGGARVGVVVGAGHGSDREGENLAARFGRVPGALPVVGLLHTSVESARAAEAHDRYAPSTRADYERLGYAYFALGHIHLRQQPLEGLPVHYAGNLQGRHAGETGEKGGLQVEAFAGASAEPHFVRFAPVRWERVRVAADPATASVDALAGGLARRVEALARAPQEALAVRLELAGETPLARELRGEASRASLAEEVARRSGALEIQIDAGASAPPLDRERLLAAPSVLATALALIERARGDAALLGSLAPPELAEAPASPEARLAYLRELLEGLPQELLLRGVEREGA
jgi:DNA repair exonuclease SbcCD nuclease subunit